MEIDEATRKAIDRGVPRRNRSKLESIVKTFGSKLANFELQEGRRGGITENSEEDRLCTTLEFVGECYREITQLPVYQGLGLTKSLFRLLANAIRLCAADLVTGALRRHAPDKEAATRDAVHWAELLTASEFEAIECELKYEKSPKPDLDVAFYRIVTSPIALFRTQLVAIAPVPFARLDFDIDATVSHAIGMLDLKIRKVVREPDDEFIEAIRRRQESKVNLEASIPGWVVTKLGTWDQVAAKVRERLPDAIVDVSEQFGDAIPPNWDWLIESSSGPLLVCWGHFPLNEPETYAIARVRQLSAICLCLDDAVDPWSSFGDPSRGQQCHVISIPLNKPQLSGAQELSSLPSAAPRGCEVSLPRWPLEGADHVRRLELRGLPEVLTWVYKQSARELSCMSLPREIVALDAFETARSLGARFGSLPTDIEQGWQIVAYCSALELLYDIKGGAKGSPISEKIRVTLDERASSLVYAAFNRRNDLIHNHERGSWEDFEQFADVVRRAIGEALRLAVSR